MYDFTELGERDDNFLNGEPPHQVHADSEREWSRLSEHFVNAGYREGITAGKEGALQSGFDGGFKDTGAPIGRELGNLRGIAAGLLSLMESSRLPETKLGNAAELLVEVRAISKGLARLQFANLAPPDEEALAHAREHAEANDEGSQIPEDLTPAWRDDLPELSLLRQRLRKALQALDLDDLLD
ncbi:uncharacterized protein FOMMEDRAFT_146353 [Fomitiporia mediterranea MF3/22]|uniref:uncharacterized protein n=1 Tax=Fomitiporia mediterranea (strain MF3/22) TaxID=694068 RepID=UPI0004408160|nr:uncharacterized protein FOMMEDRAFT_146353 [Fomitiporia mediterranea MF3/22]EJD04417.1 hypothetical protein FOMMEDRAFT_146353 [Fomitiporia mediterranea MF3/22]